jgi:DtxR family manganese transport transcriptional regulator
MIPPDPVSRSDRASTFRGVRAAHRNETAEDYVEEIFREIERDGHAKLTELAAALGVSHPTVSKTLKRLEREGYVVVQPYKQIDLTDKGRELARACRVRHEIVLAFLRSLGISEATAEHDAEGIEHHLSAETLDAMRRRLDG